MTPGKSNRFDNERVAQYAADVLYDTNYSELTWLPRVFRAQHGGNIAFRLHDRLLVGLHRPDIHPHLLQQGPRGDVPGRDTSTDCRAPLLQ